MRKSIFLILFLASSALYAQELTVVADSKGHLGYKDATGNIVIKQMYDFAEPFDANGIAKVGKSKKYGLINKSGSEVLALAYDEIEQREEGIPTRIKKGKSYGLINPSTGVILLEPKYSYVSKFNCYGLAWLTQGGKIQTVDGKQSISGGKMGIVNKEGTLLLTPKQKGVFEFSNKTKWATQAVYGEAELLSIFNYGLSDTLVTDCEYLGFSSTPLSCINAGVMNTDGEVVMNAKTYTWVSKPVEGKLRYWNVKSKKEFSYGYYDISTGKDFLCNTVSSDMGELKWITHGDFHGNIAPVNSQGEWYFINQKMEKQKSGFSAVKYKEGMNGNTGFYAGIAERSSVIYDTTGKEYCSGISFSDVELPDAHYGNIHNFALNVNGKWGLYSKEGKQLIAPQYDYMYSSRYGIYAYKKGNRWGALDEKGKVIIPAEYISVVFPAEENPKNIWVMTPVDSLYYNYSITKKQRLQEPYVDVSCFKNNMAWASPSKDNKRRVAEFPGKGYLIDGNNKCLVDKPFSYKKYEDVKTEVINNNGRPLTANQANKLILRLSRGEERYAIDSIVPSTEWDY